MPMFFQFFSKDLAFNSPILQLFIVDPHLLGIKLQAAEDIRFGLFTQLRRAAGVPGGGYRTVEGPLYCSAIS